jgi:hemerythrin-like metal-binding protein
MVNSALYIVWSDENRLGIPVIDEQHRGIVSLINSFYHFVKRGEARKVMLPVLAALVYSTSVHFMTEEELITSAGYTHAQEHIELHKTLMKRTKLIAREAASNADVDLEALAFLKDWWLGHINGADRQYARCVIDNICR